MELHADVDEADVGLVQEGQENKKGQQQVWILKEGAPVAIPVSIGTSDGIWTEITQGELQAGIAMLVATVKAAR